MRPAIAGFVGGALVLLVVASGGEASAAPFVKGPYLQSLGTTGVTVKVELERPAPVLLEIFAAGADRVVGSAASSEARAGAFQALRVDRLDPGTAYDYRIVAGAEKSELGHFTTAPASDRPFRFLVYGDSRTDHAAHAAVVSRLEVAPGELLINTGDMVQAGKEPADWQAFFDVERRLLRDRCVFAAVGNHELSRGDPAGQVAFLRYFASDGGQGSEPLTHLYGTFRWSNTRFFLLNAMDNWTGDERDWLRSALDQSLGEPGLLHRIAVLHHGPFSSGPHGGNERLSTGGVIALMRDRKVDLVFAGHDHIYERGAGEGLKYVITGGAGAPLYERERIAKETLAFEAVHHFLEVEVDGDRVKIVARRASGTVIEACGFHGDGGWECDGPEKPAEGPGARALARPRACGCSLPGRDRGHGGWALGLALAAAAVGRRIRKDGEA